MEVFKISKMKNILIKTTRPYPQHAAFNIGMLVLRAAASLELVIVHGLKKIGVGVANAEKIPNPLHFPEQFNNLFATAANIIFPFFVLIGLFTRAAVLPTLAVTLTGYFIVHSGGSLSEKDTPFIYSLIFITILILGPGKYSFDNIIYKKLKP
jgi:putative oxidoreductase